MTSDAREAISLSTEDVEHIEAWSKEATPGQVAAAMREKLRLERALESLRVTVELITEPGGGRGD